MLRRVTDIVGSVIIAQMLVWPLFLGCTYLARWSTPAGAVGSFEDAKIIYGDVLETAVGEVEACSLGGTTWADEDCANLAVTVMHVSQEAAKAIQLGDLLSASLTPIECNEAATPGCGEILRLQQIQQIVRALQHLTTQLRGDE